MIHQENLIAPVPFSAAEALNRDCYCRTLDAAALRGILDADPQFAGLMASLQESRPNLFSTTAVFISPAIRAQLQAVVAAIERVIALPEWQELALARSPQIARHAFGPAGVFMSYDFHLGPQGPGLIEINSNAGGALLNAALAQAQLLCCEPLDLALVAARESRAIEQAFVDMFLREWRLQRGAGRPGLLLVVDDQPDTQYLAPEFAMFGRLFERHGIDAAVVDAAQLQWRDGALWWQDRRVDMVYNRLTDFYLAAPEHAALREAYESGAIVLTPHPRSHALHADKRNLVTLGDSALLESWGVSAPDRALLAQVVPRSWLVDADNADALWARRRELFFKPAGGYGAKAAYRGDKLTRRVWGEILTGCYIAQTLVPPSERVTTVDELPTTLKFDLRAYTYEAHVLLLAARMYAGQSTNFRTPGGGFAAVIVVP